MTCSDCTRPATAVVEIAGLPNIGLPTFWAPTCEYHLADYNLSVPVIDFAGA